MKVRLSTGARDFLHEEVRYLRRHSPSAAEKLLSTIEDVRFNLSRFPQLGPQAQTSPVRNSRRWVAGDYILDYEVSEGAISITSIRHGRMMPPILDVDDDFDFEASAEP